MNLSAKPLAMAYVPWQSFENVLDGKLGLKKGSIFEDLVLPFIGTPAACQSECETPCGKDSCPVRYPNRPQNYSCRRRCNY